MRHISTTPFGRRALSAAHLARQHLAEAPAPTATVDKWALLRDLTDARPAFDISDRALAVLSALMSFHRGKLLEDGPGLIVFPSNQSLSGRLHGMPESTLRRHLAALVRAGLVLRHDSPNGKRYALRGQQGQIGQAFGFDLRPLLVRADQITRAATSARQAAQKLRNLRQLVVLRLRDAAKLLIWSLETGTAVPSGLSARITELQRHLRRKLGLSDLQVMAGESAVILDQFTPLETACSGGNDGQNERHIQDSDSLPKESESCADMDQPRHMRNESDEHLPLELVLKAAPEITLYARDPVRNWRDYHALTEFVRPMLGIRPDVWAQSLQRMGQHTAAITLACILQRAATIRDPGAYLRTLSKQAELGNFTARPMVQALLRAES